MVKITANSSLIKGNNRSGKAGYVLHNVREEEIVLKRVKTVMSINRRVRKRRGSGLGQSSPLL